MSRIICSWTAFFIIWIGLWPAAGYTITEADVSSQITILITDFRIHAEDKLDYLRDGIMEMLATRLPQPGQVRIVQAAQTLATDAAAVKAGKVQGATYVLIGAVTVFGDKVSTDARLLDVNNSQPMMRFSRFGQTPGDVLVHVEQLSGEILAFISAGDAGGVESVQVPDTASNEPSTEKPADMWSSHSLDFSIVNLAVGDMDGDGDTEVAAAGRQTLRLFQWSANTLKPWCRKDMQAHERIIHVDVADINANGRAEIYVTRMGRHQRLASLVLEWENGRLAMIADQLPWYLRVVRMPGQAPVLAAQKQGISASKDALDLNSPDLFLPGMVQLVWQQKALQIKGSMALPQGVSLFDFAWGDVMPGGEAETIAFGPKDRLHVYAADGQRRWQSNQAFGGREAYLQVPSDIDHKRHDRIYLPHRIIVADCGSSELFGIIVVRNHDIGRRVLSRFRHFTKGDVVCLAWNNTTFQPLWQTGPLQGYISDLALADLKPDNQKGLILALVNKDTGFFKKEQSHILIQKIPIAEAQ